MLPLTATSLLHVIGVVEVLVGGVILRRYPVGRLHGGHLELLTTGHYFHVPSGMWPRGSRHTRCARLTEAGVDAEARDRIGSVQPAKHEKIDCLRCAGTIESISKRNDALKMKRLDVSGKSNGFRLGKARL
jgi:hypothetical protein